MGKHIKKWDNCFDKLKKEKGESGAASICSSSIDNAGLKAKYQKRDKKDYYSNIKKDKKKNENMKTFEEFSINEDAFSNNATYPGPNITNQVSGQIVGSGSDGKLGVKQTEIEGGDDGVTGGGEFPLKYGGIKDQKVKTMQSRQRKSAIKKIAKLNKLSASGVSKMKSFADFQKNNDDVDDKEI